MRNYCPYCGEEIPPKAEFCTECGEQLPPIPIIRCPECSTANKPKARFCEKCGERLTHPDTMVICPECGEVGYATDRYCSYCGEEWDFDDYDDSHLAASNVEFRAEHHLLTDKIGYVDPPVNTTPSPSLKKTASLKKHGCLYYIVIGVVVLFLVRACSSSSDSDSNSSEGNTNYTPSTTLSAATSAPESEKEPDLLNLSGLTLEEVGSKISSVYENCSYDVSDGLITFTMPYPESLLSSLDMLAMEQRMYYIFSQLSQRDDITVAYVFFEAELKGGGTVHAMYATMEDDTFRRLDFSTLSSNDMKDVCDTYYVHPNLQ